MWVRSGGYTLGKRVWVRGRLTGEDVGGFTEASLGRGDGVRAVEAVRIKALTC